MLVADSLLFAVLALLVQTGNPFKSCHMCQAAQGGSFALRSERNLDGLTNANAAQSLPFIGPYVPPVVIMEESGESTLVALNISSSGSGSLDSISYESDRISFNVALRSLLSRGQQAFVAEQMLKLKEQDVHLNIDTVHIMLSDSFSRRDSTNVESLFREHFKSQALPPSSRTLNILMEGYRTLRDDAKVYYYRDCFRHYNLSMDSYSYSTLVRTVRAASAVKRILAVAEEGNSLSFPLIRCAIESLGKLGDPLGAVATAGRYLTLSDSSTSALSSGMESLHRDCNNVASIFDNSASGDSLLVALLENPDLHLVRSEKLSEDQLRLYSSNDRVTDESSSSSSRGGSDIDPVWDGSGGEEEGETSGLERRVLGMRCGDAALDLILSAILVDTDRAAVTVSKSESGGSLKVTRADDNRGVLVCGSKGWCRMFTFLQRGMKESLEDMDRNKEHSDSSKSKSDNSKMKGRYDISKARMKKLRETRDRLWSKLSAEILMTESRKQDDVLASVGQIASDASPVPVSAEGSDSLDVSYDITTIGSPVIRRRNERDKIELNGRLSDALLRCYLDDAEKAKKMWKNSILPLSKRTSPTTSRSFNEICEKSLEALMFVSGYNSRADLGFEIALTVRNRNWGNAERIKLAKSYVQGKMQSRGYKTQWLKNNILNDGFERSIESELGVQLLDFYYETNPAKKKDWAVKRIRIQFKNENSPTSLP